MRGHGETVLVGEHDGLDLDFSGTALAGDVRDVLVKMFAEGSRGIVLVGHGMGGAVATLAGEGGIQGRAGLVVRPQVERTALEAPASMHTVLQNRPRMLSSAEQAVEWCVWSGQVGRIYPC